MDLSRVPVQQGFRLRGEAVTRLEIVSHLLLLGTAALSIVLALSLSPDATGGRALPGLAYGWLAIVMPLYGTWVGRRVDALAAARTA